MASGKRRRSSREPSTSQCQYVPAHPMRSDASETTVAIASLNTELRCPVCLRIMRDPVATECLHRFCKDCIERCQRLLKKECPSCRKPIATRRSMRPDPNFAGLIGALYPDLDELEAEEERTMAAENERLTRAHAEKITRDWQRQRSRQAVEPAAKIEYVYSGRGAMHTRSMGSESGSESEGEEKEEEEEGEEEEGEEKEEEEEGEEEEEKEAAEEEEEEKAAAEEEEEEEEEEASPAAAEAEAAGGGARDEAPPAAAKSRARRVQRLVERENEIAFRLTRHPLEVELPMLAKEKVAVDRVVKVETVQKFLSVKLKISDATKFQLRVRLQDFSHVLLLPEMSLGDVVQLYELDTKHLEFQFSYVHPPAALGGE